MKETAIKELRVEVTDAGITQTTAKIKDLTKSEHDLTKAQTDRMANEAAAARQYAQLNAMIQQQTNLMRDFVNSNRMMAAANDNTARSFTGVGLEAAEVASHLSTVITAAGVLSPKFRAVVNELKTPIIDAATKGITALATGFIVATNTIGRGLVTLGQSAALSTGAIAPFGAGIASAGAAMAAFNPSILGVAGSILGRLLPALRALSVVGLLIEVVNKYGEAWELGGKKLEEYRKIADQAAQAGVGTQFFQRIQTAATDAKMPVDAITESFKRLAAVTKDTLGGSEFENRLKALREAGNFQGNTGVAQLAQANTTEQKFRAIVSLVEQAMNKGERLAALDLTSKFLSPAVQQALEKNSEALTQMLASADALEQKKIVSDEAINNALDLERRYDAAVKILEQRWHPIQDLLTAGGIKLREIWVSIVEAVAAVVDALTRAVIKVGELLAPLAAVAQSVASVGSKLLTINPVAGPAAVLGAGVSSAAGLVAPDTMRRTEEYSVAVNKLASGLKNANTVQQAAAETNAVVGRVFQDTSKAVEKQTQSVQAQKSAYERAIEGVQKHISRMEADAKAVGLGVAAREQFRTQANLENAAMQSGIPLTAARRAEIEKLAKAAGDAAQNLEKAKIASEIKFQKGSIGLSQEDLQIAQQLRGLYGNDIPAAMSSTEAAQIRILNAQRELSDGFRDVGASIFKAFLSGKNVMDAMVASLDKLADTLANSAFNNLLSGNPAQMGIGAIQAGASALISIFTGDQKQKKELEEARKQWEGMADQVAAFNAAAAGFDLGPLTQAANSLFSSLKTLQEAAAKAGDNNAVNQLGDTLSRGLVRLTNEFINGAQNLSPLQKALKETSDEAMGLSETLRQMKYTGLADAVDAALPAKLAALAAAIKAQADFDIKAQINTLSGFGWLNEINQAWKDFQEALSTGVDAGVADTFIRLKLQSIVDNAKLTGQAFQNLITGMPGIAGYIHEYNAAVEESGNAAANSAAAIEKANLQMRLLVATTDQSTLSGALAVNALRQQMEMNDAIAANSQNIALLQQVQAAETYNIVKSFADKAVAEAKAAADAQARALEDAQNTFNGFVRNIHDFINHYLSGSQGPLSPSARLANAQSAYNSQLALAQGGDRDALNSITQYFTDLIDASKGFYASSAAGQAINATALAQLQALPGQISPEQFIVNAINSTSADQVTAVNTLNDSVLGQLSTAVMQGSAQNFALALVPHFDSLLDPTTGLLKQAQLETKLNLPDGSLDKIFKELDGNGNGILEKSELIKSATQGTNTNTGGTKTNTDSLPDQATKIAGMETSLLAMAQVSGATQNTASILAAIQTSMGPSLFSTSQGIWGNLRLLVNNPNISQTPVASGGMIRGPGSGMSDSIPARLSNGEFVIRSAAAAALGAANLFYMNDNGRLPQTGGVSFSSSTSEVVNELRALRAEVAQLRAENTRATVAAAEHVGEKLDDVSDTMDSASRAAKLLAA